jgi:hypothetical protein
MELLVYLFIGFIFWMLAMSAGNNQTNSQPSAPKKSILFRKRSARIGVLLSVGWIILAILYSENSRDYRSFFDITWKYINSSEEETLMFIFLPLIITLFYSFWLNLLKSMYMKVANWVNSGEK